MCRFNQVYPFIILLDILGSISIDLDRGRTNTGVERDSLIVQLLTEIDREYDLPKLL